MNNNEYNDNFNTYSNNPPKEETVENTVQNENVDYSAQNDNSYTTPCLQ